MSVAAAVEGISVQSNIITATSVFYMLLVPAIALWFIYWRLSRRHVLELAEKIPGENGYPLIGCALDFTGSAHQIFKTLSKYTYKHKDVVKFWLGPKLLVLLYHPDDIEIILSSQVHLTKGHEYQLFEPWFGRGLLISNGQTWRNHRKLIAPTFHLNILKSFIDLFNRNSRDVVEKLRKENGKTFDCHDYMSECTVETLLETVMGVPKDSQNRGCFEYAMAVMKMCDILHMRHVKLWLRFNTIFNMTSLASTQKKLLGVIHGLTKQVIKDKKEDFAKGKRPTSVKIIAEDSKEKTIIEGLSYGQSSGLKDDIDAEDVGEKKRLAFLDLLLESSRNGSLITDTEIQNQVDTIMFEGHDTTAAGSSFFLSMMGIHQHIQDKVIEEVDRIFGDSDRPATFQDTLEMKYLERCMMETLRCYPPVPMIGRQLTEDVKLKSSNVVIPAGTTCGIATFRVHRRDDIYPNPHVFDPDNFLPERCANRHYYAFIPFSAGPRSCVGRKYAMLKLKIILSTIMRNFRVHSDLQEKDFKVQADIILKREEGFNIRLEPRKPTVMTAA